MVTLHFITARKLLETGTTLLQRFRIASKRLLWERLRALFFDYALESMWQLLEALFYGLQKAAPVIAVNSS